MIAFVPAARGGEVMRRRAAWTVAGAMLLPPVFALAPVTGLPAERRAPVPPVPVADTHPVPVVPRVPILLYHRIGPAEGPWPQLYVGLPAFARQMAALAGSGARSLTVDEVVQAAAHGTRFAGGAFAITFDDATRDQYELAFPILVRHRLKATFFVSPGLIGRPGYMTWAQIREVAASRLVAIEAHTVSHADLTELDPERARDEISGSKRLLERQLGISVDHFAYPFGKHDAAVAGLVRRAGFHSALTTAYGVTRRLAEAFTWGRMSVHGHYKPKDLVAVVRSD